MVGQRMQEMGIRIALGASKNEVVRLTLRSGFVLASAGIGIGLFGCWAVSEMVESLLFGVQALNPLFMVAAGISLVVVAASATGLPALRATRANPVSVMRAE